MHLDHDFFCVKSVKDHKVTNARGSVKTTVENETEGNEDEEMGVTIPCNIICICTLCLVVRMKNGRKVKEEGRKGNPYRKEGNLPSFCLVKKKEVRKQRREYCVFGYQTLTNLKYNYL